VQLRPFQQETLTAIVDNLQAGVRQQLIVWATGCGKTLLAACLPAALRGILDGKMLFVAHRDEILQQTIDKIHTWAPELKVGLEKAEHHAASDSDVIVASVASVGRSGSTRLDHFWDDISVIVLDECHHAASDQFLNVLEDSGVLREDSRKLLIGLTATPKRRNLTRDEKKQRVLLDDESTISLKSVFKKIVYSFPIRKAIKQGYLVPLRGFRVGTQTSLDNVRSVGGDFKADELSAAINTSERNLQIVKAWQECAEGRQTVCFTAGIEHGKELAEAFTRNGINFVPIWGSDPDREVKLRKHEAGEITGLCNCALLTEGYDSPTVSCIVLARPTRSSTMMTQQVGRGTRLYEGKQDCIVIDVVDCTKKCSLVTFPSLLGLNPDFNLHGTSATAAVEKIEELQEKNVGIDFANLTDLSKVKTYVEALDLFADPFTAEVKEHSNLRWQEQADGSYMIAVPEEQVIKEQYWRYRHEKLVLVQNDIEEWELSISSVDPEKKLGTFNSLKEAFTTADEVLQRCRPDRMKLLLREAAWHGYPASDATKKYLKRLVGKKPFAYCLCPVGAMCSGVAGQLCVACAKTQLTAGQATTVITKLKVK
jgi:superfamily II DNA or RNA helicase